METSFAPAYAPGGATLIEVLQTSAFSEQTGNVSGVVLNYSAPSVDFSITESKNKYEKGLGDTFSGVPDNGATKEVALRGVTATAASRRRGRLDGPHLAGERQRHLG